MMAKGIVHKERVDRAVCFRRSGAKLFRHHRNQFVKLFAPDVRLQTTALPNALRDHDRADLRQPSHPRIRLKAIAKLSQLQYYRCEMRRADYRPHTDGDRG